VHPVAPGVVRPVHIKAAVCVPSPDDSVLAVLTSASSEYEVPSQVSVLALLDPVLPANFIPAVPVPADPDSEVGW
jgi:hypothetical protein